MSRMYRIAFRCTAEQKSRVTQFANRFDRSESDTCRWLLAEALQLFDAQTTVPNSSRDDGLANQSSYIEARDPSVHTTANGSSVVMVLRLDVLPPSATLDAFDSLPLRGTRNDFPQAEKGGIEE